MPWHLGRGEPDVSMCMSAADAGLTPRGPHRTSQEGPWISAAQKSNMSGEEVRAEVVEDIE